MKTIFIRLHDYDDTLYILLQSFFIYNNVSKFRVLQTDVKNCFKKRKRDEKFAKFSRTPNTCMCRE